MYMSCLNPEHCHCPKHTAERLNKKYEDAVAKNAPISTKYPAKL